LQAIPEIFPENLPRTIVRATGWFADPTDGGAATTLSLGGRLSANPLRNPQIAKLVIALSSNMTIAY
jgi:hypothetical protein